MLKRLLTIAAVFGIALGMMLASFFIYIRIPVLPKEPTITIEEGTPLREISQQLKAQGIIRHAFPFLLYVAISGKSRDLKAGDYDFSGKVTPYQVLDALAEGKVVLNKILLVEGWTLKQFADSLQTLPFIKDPIFAQEFLRLAQEQNLEGHLLPDTYYFSSRITPQELIQTIVKAFEEFYQEALKNQKTLPALSQKEIVTMASMIEKETYIKEERPLIASVFYNRLRKKMALASDPTVIYGLKNFDGNLKKYHLSQPHPYNTYLFAGLPPGSICNPSRSSILAALNPAQTNYFYFVSKNDGTHHFSQTAAQHLMAVEQFQRNPEKKLK